MERGLISSSLWSPPVALPRYPHPQSVLRAEQSRMEVQTGRTKTGIQVKRNEEWKQVRQAVAQSAADGEDRW